MVPPSVLTPHGSLSVGSVRLFAPLPNSNVRSLTTGMLERSGLGISVAGTWLRSGLAGFEVMRNSRIFPMQGSEDLPARASDKERSLEGFLPSWCSQRFVNQTLSPRL